jgi:ABC-type transport system involved in multi-copper enzyme maturation permease subunit
LNFGLVLRSLRETFGITLVFVVVLTACAAMLAYILPGVQERMLARSSLPPFVLSIRRAMLGDASMTRDVASVAFAIAWSHPVVLALLFAHCVILTTRVPAGEVERGTMDILLGLPVSRWALHVSETVAWLISGALVLAAVYGGSWLGAQFVKAENRPDWGMLSIVLANLGAVYAVAGAVGMMSASWTNRRTRAVMTVLIVLVGSMLVFLLRAFWPPIDRMGWVSILYYYKPATILQKREWPWFDLAVLAGASAVLWAVAGEVLNRRALTTT